MPQTARHCPALFISAPASNQGKTTVTAALARYHRNQGRKVRVFKTGPDFLDPMVLQQASGQPVYQLDLWMGGEAHCRNLLYNAAQDADLLLVEGAMGLFDGTPCSADLAQTFGIPVAAVIDASGMAQTFGALAYGLAHYREGLPFAGVLANRVASANHSRMLLESLPQDLKMFGALPRDDAFTLPSRHLGLVQAQEIADLENRLQLAAAAMQQTGLCALPEPVAFETAEETPFEPLLQDVTIAIARDAAFAFIYPANLDLLQRLGANLVFFSPLAGDSLPQADSLYLPGGYPELHLQTLAQNQRLRADIRAHFEADKPILAECGGMLYLLETLADKSGAAAQMAGIMPGHAALQGKLANLGLHEVQLPEGRLRGHCFHYSTMQTSLAPLVESMPQRHGGKPVAIYRERRLTASYMHFYFPSNPEAAARLLGAPRASAAYDATTTSPRKGAALLL